MQKFAASLGRAVKPVGVVVGTAASGSTSHCRAPKPANVEQGTPPHSPTKLEKAVSVEEGLEGWGFVQMRAPVQKDEVSAALGDLAVLGGLRRAPSPPALAPATDVQELGPVGSEDGDAASSATSDGAEANRQLSRAETEDLGFGMAAWEGEAPSADPMETLSGVIGNLLNNPEVVGVIQSQLVRDPAFYQLMRQVNPGLPFQARPLLITELSDTSSEASLSYSDYDTDSIGEVESPLAALLGGLQRGVCTMAAAVGEAFAHLGAFLRGLGENLREALEGTRSVQAAAAAGEATNNNDGPSAEQRSWESALVKVACAVAVLVIAKRVRAFA